MDFVPRSGQDEIIAHIQSQRRVAVWAGMGVGKTGSTLVALDQLSWVYPDTFPALILAPLRVAKSTWPDEVEKWDNLKHLKVSVITGSPAQRLKALQTKAHIYTMNYEHLPWLVEHLGAKWPFRTVVADEFTRLKSFRLRQGSKRARALGRVAHTLVNRFIGLTGTPAPNGIANLWGQTWFLDKGLRLCKTFSGFEARWFTRGWDGFSLVPNAGAQEEVQELLRDICRTVTVPVEEPILNPIYVDLPPDARRVYNDMERQMYAEIGAEGVEAANAAVKSSKCHQIADGALYLEEGGWEEIHTAKLDALESVVEEANGMPVLVSYTFKFDKERILKRFKGAKELDSNPQTIRDWNAGKIPILVAHPASAGHGLNLQDGSNILCYYSIDWNLEEHMQIKERLGPMRQKQAGHNRPVYVHVIMARDTVDDELIWPRLHLKKTVQEVLLEALQRRKLAA